MPTEMTSTEALAFARAYDAVDRALSFPDDVRERAENAYLGFNVFGHAVPRRISGRISRHIP